MTTTHPQRRRRHMQRTDNVIQQLSTPALRKTRTVFIWALRAAFFVTVATVIAAIWVDWRWVLVAAFNVGVWFVDDRIVARIDDELNQRPDTDG